jgi:hypothetical protein
MADRNTKWILDDKGEPIACNDIAEWGRWFKKNDVRRVALDMVGTVKLSTVFLGLDHNWQSGPPILFETMIFGGPHDEYQDRYATRAEAVANHARLLALLKREQGTGCTEDLL